MNAQDFAATGAAIQAYLREQGVFVSQTQAMGVVGLLLSDAPDPLRARATELALDRRKQQLVQLSYLLGRPSVHAALTQEGLHDAAAQSLADVADLLPSSALQTFDVDTLLAVLTSLEHMTRPELELPEDHPLRLRASFVDTLLRLRSGYDEEVANRLSAQFTAFTGRAGSIARELYREFGWEAANTRLHSSFSFTPAIGPLCIWSDKEQAHWIQHVGWDRDGWSATGYSIEDQGTVALKPGERWVPWTLLSKEMIYGSIPNSSSDSTMTVNERAVFRFSLEELERVLAEPEPTLSESLPPNQMVEARMRRRFVTELVAAKAGLPSLLTERLVTQIPMLVPTLSVQDVRDLVETRGFDVTLQYLNTEFRVQPMLGSWLRCSRHAEQFVAVDGSWTMDPLAAAGYHEKDLTELGADQFWFRFPRTATTPRNRDAAPETDAA